MHCRNQPKKTVPSIEARNRESRLKAKMFSGSIGNQLMTASITSRHFIA
jgi:hypothetical protein